MCSCTHARPQRHMGWVVNAMPGPLYFREKDPLPIVQEAGWSSRPDWKGAENFARTGFDPRTVQPVASRYIAYAISTAILLCTYFLMAQQPQWARSPHCRGFTLTLTHTTLGRTPLDE
jgi:hypothetical protein